MRRLSALLVAVPRPVRRRRACSSDDTASAATTVVARPTPNACRPRPTSTPASSPSRSRTRASKPTELYVFGKGDKVISEVENVGPGTSRSSPST